VHHLGEPGVAARTGLVRRLGLAAATALVVGEVIGVGIFLTPAGMVKNLGSPFWLLAVWLIMGCAALGGALCYGALAARFPEDGGSYVYLREVFGQRTAFAYGWLSLLVTDPGLTAMLAVGLSIYASHIISLSFWQLKAVAIAAIAVPAVVNIVGVSLGARLLGALAALKVGLLAFLVIWGFSLGGGDWSNFSPFWSQRPGSDPLLLGLGAAFLSAFVSFAGWWDSSKIAGELRDPGRTLPRAFALGLLIVTVVYVAVTAVFIYLVPPVRIGSDEAFAAQAGAALFGRSGEVAFATIIVISVAGSLAAILMAAPRVYYAMARDRLILPGLATIDPRFGTPARAIALQAVLAAVLAASGSFEQILAYFLVPTLLFVALTVAGVFPLRSRKSSAAPLAIPGYPLSPLLFLIPILVVIALGILRDPLRTSIGLAVVALAVPVSARLLSSRQSSAERALAQSPSQTAASTPIPPLAASGPSSFSPSISTPES
jgi:APA family basic amino acid/polyamine antiporter